MSNDLRSEIAAIITKDRAPADTLKPEQRLEDKPLGLDSLDCVEIAMTLEEAFRGQGIGQIDDDEIAAWETVGDIFKSVESRVNRKAGAA